MRNLLTRIGSEERDSGVTLVELLVTMIVLAIVLPMTYSVLITVERQTKDETARADAVGDARLALQQIDRLVRSGNVLYDPATETLPLSMRVYTQANGERRCVQWQVHDGLLRSRSWSPTWTVDALVSDWGVVARNIVNTTATPPFALQGGSTPFGSRLVDIKLLVQNPSSEGQPIDVTSSLSGRNTAYGYDPGVCNPVPPA